MTLTRRMSTAILCQSSTSEPVSEDEARDECPPDEAVLQRAELEEYDQDYEEDQRGPYQLSSPFLRPGTGPQPKAPLAGAKWSPECGGSRELERSWRRRSAATISRARGPTTAGKTPKKRAKKAKKATYSATGAQEPRPEPCQ